jgi:hypothetical protein
MKNNTNPIFSFLELYKVDRDATIKSDIYKWVEATKKIMSSGKGGLYSSIELTGNNIKMDVDLTSNFAVIDVLCDCAWVFKEDRFLRMAREIADFWLSLQSSSTGLFPLTPKSKSSYLDSETDMIIALIKLYELTGEVKYKESAEKTFEGILQFHHAKRGYVLSVDINNGKILNPIVKTKFVSLLLKPFILFISGRDIYKTPWLHNLLKDR